MQNDSSDMFPTEKSVERSTANSIGFEYVVGENFYVSSNGFASLYLARRGGRLFILKAIREEYRSDKVALAALNKEFDIGFRLDVPDVIKTIDMVTLPSVGTALVLEYCSGKNLRAAMDGGLTLSGEALEAMTRRLINATEAIHRSGVVHRDIKPSNILYDESSGNIHLIDFGCADAFDHTLFKGNAGTALYKSVDMSNPEDEDWYALSLTIAELANHCTDKHARNEILGWCDRMRNGQNPLSTTSNRSASKLRLLMLIIAGILGVLIAGYIIIFNDSSKETESKSGSTEITDSIEKTSEQIENSDKEIVTPSVSPTSVSETKEAEAAESESAALNKLNSEEEFTKQEKRYAPYSAVNDLPKAADAKDTLILKVRSAAMDEYYAAAQREARMYKQFRNKPLSKEQRDSIARIAYDEQTCCNAILMNLGQLPPGADMQRARNLIRERYVSLFPHPDNRKNRKH